MHEDDKTARTRNDLHVVADFFGDEANCAKLPLDRFFEPVHITYWVDKKAPDPKADFDALAAAVLAEGGRVEHRPHGDTVQHVATLPFGSGRIEYRVMWIEREANGEGE
jgi:hypothetical protein